MSKFFKWAFREFVRNNVVFFVSRQVHENELIAAILAEKETGSSRDALMLPDPFLYVFNQPNLFDPLGYLRQRMDILKICTAFLNRPTLAKFKPKEIDFTCTMTREFQSLVNCPLSNQLQEQISFCWNNEDDFYDVEHPEKKLVVNKDLRLFIFAKLNGLLQALELYGKNGIFDSFNGVYELYERKESSSSILFTLTGPVIPEYNEPLSISQTDPTRTIDLIVLVKELINQQRTTWNITQADFEAFQAGHGELFSYSHSIYTIPITYITSSFLSILKGPEHSTTWDWRMQPDGQFGVQVRPKDL